MSRLTGDPLDVVRDALITAGCDPRGGQRITARCPAHDDSNPSLSVARGTEQPVVLRCHAGCDPDAVLAALRLDWADLCESDDERPVQRREVATYRYVDEMSEPLFEVVRFEPKDFRQRRPDGTWSISGVRRVLFRLPAVIEAVRSGRVVYVCEGEKDVLAIERAGAVATTNAGGAMKWRTEYNAVLAGADVVIVADDDEPGRRHAADVARQLGSLPASVRTRLPVAGAKDIAEHLGRGLGLDDLRPMADAEPPPDAEPWETPAPLGPKGKVPVFPAHRFPPWLNSYCCAVAEMLQTPVDLPGMLCFSVLGAVAGGRAVVQVRPGWNEPLNLFTVTALPPGERKTPVFMRVIRPIEEAERSAIDAAKPERADAAARLSRAKAIADKADAEASRASKDAMEEAVHYAAQMRLLADAIIVPVSPRLLGDDATPESVTSLLAQQGGRLALFSDEGEVFSMMAGRYSSSGPNLGVYLKGHVGSPIRVDRKGRDAEVVDRPALTLGLTIQPDMLTRLASIEGARGRGLLARFLWSVPVSRVGRREIDTDPADPEIEEHYVTEMRRLYDDLKDWTDPAVLVFSPEANRTMAAFERRLEARLTEGGDLAHISDWGAKLAGHTARLAGLLHLATYVREGWQRNVESSVVDDAIQFAEYLIIHALIAFDAMDMDPEVENTKAVLGWVSRRERFSKRDLYKAYQARFQTVRTVEPVLDLLCEHGYVRLVPPPPTTGRGRPASPEYIVNPLTRRGEVRDPVSTISSK